MIKVLELFSGTGSVGKCCKALGWEVVSVDLLLPADHQVDIMEFNYKQYKKDEFDIVWASPPCTAYSQLQKCWYGRKRKDGTTFTKEKHEEDMNEADKLIYKSLEIIDYFNPHYWYLENPLSTLKDRDVLKDRYYHIVDYCMYSDWGYKKRTCIWTNRKEWIGKMCDGSGACGNMMDKQHTSVLGNGYEIIDGKKVLCNTKEKRDKLRTTKQKLHRERMGTPKTIQDGDKIIRCNTAELRKKYKDYPNLQKYGLHGTTLHQRYRIPEDLIYSLFLD